MTKRETFQEYLDRNRDKPPPFDYHSCWRCRDGAKPCAGGNPRGCPNLHARDD